MAQGNNNTVLNTSELMTGKDGRLYVQLDGVNYLLAEINEYKVVMNINSTQYQPVGSILEGTVPLGVTFDLTYTEAVVRDDLVTGPLIKAIGEGYLPTYNFQGSVTKPDGVTTQTIAYNNAIPNGTFDLQSVVPGDIIKRAQSFRLNTIPSYVTGLVSNELGTVAAK